MAVLVVLLAVCLSIFAQTAPQQTSPTPPSSNPSANNAAVKPAPAAGGSQRGPNRAGAYYHYTLAHMYEELFAIYQSGEWATKAIEEYRLAIENDPSSEYLNSGLAELYAKTGRIRDAVNEAQDILKRDPKNLEARKLLGRIYLRSLGDLQSGSQSSEVLKRAIEQYEKIVQIEPANIDNHLLLGRLYRANNDMLKAESEFKAAVTLQPGSEEAVTMLAYLYNEEGDSKRATQVLNSIPDSERSGKIYSALGFTYEQQKDYKSAIAAYRKATEDDKDNLDAMRGLAQNLLNDNQTEAALEQYKAIVEADPHDAQSYMHMAEIYRRSGKYDLALEALKKASTEFPDSVEIPYNLAVIYQAEGNFDEATKLLQDLIKKTEKADGSSQPGDRNNRAVFLERLGAIYRDQNKTQAAVDTFRKMLEMGDENASRGYQQIIDTYREAKEWNQATATAREASAKFPNDRSLKFGLAMQLADQGQGDTAIAQVKALLKGTPEDRDAYMTLGQIYSRLKRWPEAEQALAKADELSSKPEEKDYVTFMLASVYERQKKYDPAEELFKKLLARDPNNAGALNYLGYMLADRGTRLEEALGYVKRAVQLDPQNGAYIDSLGWAYFKLGRYDLAEENLRRANERVNNDPTVLAHLGELFQKTDRLKLATAYWERALEEWNKSVPADVDTGEVARVQKNLDAARVKLARENAGQNQNSK
ncbi:MAG TPA: tetratricopeptide repeat protein [Terriglobales bacterium]|nr:tetratricopeptide repeat protein [Terriglobales bacterium]